MNRITLALLALVLLGPGALAEVELASVFGDHMVLQRDKDVRIWGKADPGEAVNVSFADQHQATKADKQGDWSITLKPMQASAKGRTLTIAGKNTVTIRDVVVGEVWVASGQSNMAWTVAASANAKQEIADSANDQVRMWTAERTVKAEPAFDVKGGWRVSSPQTTGDFSAVAYYFARDLQQQLGVPIGVLHSSWGGTPVESWTSRGRLEQIDWAKPILERFDAAAAAFDKNMAEYNKAVKLWEKTRNGPANTGFKDGYAKPDFDDSKWQTMKLPQQWENAGLDKDGVVWFRRSFDLPAHLAGQKLKLELGPIDDGDTTYANGKQVGETPASIRGGWQRERVYTLPAELTKGGKLTLAVRVVDLAGGGGVWGKPEQLKLSREDGRGEALALAGDWKYLFTHEIDAANRPVRPPARPFGPDHPHAPAGLFNGMISPILPYTIRGAIWYQGESNASRAQQYGKLFPAMIEDWRRQFGQGDFPFLFVQLANYRKPTDQVVDTDWAHLREAQLRTARRIKNTGMAVTIDIGAANDIHPRNKQDVGKRLARWALADTYGRDVVRSGPFYQSSEVKGDQILIRMVNFGSTLKSRDGKPLLGFTIAAKDGKFVKADAELVGQDGGDKRFSVIAVRSDQVKNPVAVRYAWEDNPDEANLVNEEGLPASPFRTDDWKGPTDGRR